MSQQQKVKSKLHHNFLIPGVQILPFIDGGGGAMWKNKDFWVIFRKKNKSSGKFRFYRINSANLGLIGLR